ncbi:MAG: hypothetical protein HQK91_05160 [Nitrospirae bacterium]|nr:hypothetical protein [Nitrospirota bacterium]
MFIKVLNIKINIVIGFAALLMLSITIAFIVTNGMKKVTQSVNNADDVNRLVKYIEHARIEEKNYIISGDIEFIKTVLNILNQMENQVVETKERSSSTNYINQMDSIIDAVKKYKMACTKFAEIYDKQKSFDTIFPRAIIEFERKKSTEKIDDNNAKELCDNLHNEELCNASIELITQAGVLETICLDTRRLLKASMLSQIALANNIIFYGTIIIILFGIIAAYFIIYLITSRQQQQLNHVSDTEKLVSIGRLSAGVAHEVNNPLADASLNIEMLKDDLLNNKIDAEFTHKLETIERDLDRVSSITKELLQFSRSSESEFKAIDINNLIESALLLLKNKLQYVHVSKKLHSLPEINGDPIKLEQVLLNIINNAAESLGKDGEIQIISTYNRGQIKIEIADNGCGIPVENRSKIFDPFFTTKEVGKGTGLGLSIAYGIVSQHKGIISFISNENIGTRMIIKLPVEIKKDEEPSGAASIVTSKTLK